MGSMILENFGWALGIYITSFLGFFGLIIGENLGSNDGSNDLRRRLGNISQVAVTPLAPALMLVVLYSFARPQTIGVLILIVPAVLLIVYLATQIAVFAVPNNSVQRKNAELSIIRSVKNADRLTNQSTHNPWLSYISNNLVASCVTALLGGLLSFTTHWNFEAIIITLKVFLISIISFAILQFTLFMRLAVSFEESGFLDRLAGWLIHVMLLTIPLLISFSLYIILWKHPYFGTLNLLGILSTVALSSKFAERLPQKISNWSTRRGAIRQIAQLEAKRLSRAIDKLRELSVYET